jgi:hypothetical protein
LKHRAPIAPEVPKSRLSQLVHSDVASSAATHPRGPRPLIVSQGRGFSLHHRLLSGARKCGVARYPGLRVPSLISPPSYAGRVVRARGFGPALPISIACRSRGGVNWKIRQRGTEVSRLSVARVSLTRQPIILLSKGCTVAWILQMDEYEDITRCCALSWRKAQLFRWNYVLDRLAHSGRRLSQVTGNYSPCNATYGEPRLGSSTLVLRPSCSSCFTGAAFCLPIDGCMAP